MDTKNNSIGHEVVDASIRGILYAGAGLAVATVLSALLVYGIFQYLTAHPLATEPANPMVELKDLRAQEDRLLSTYGWTDKKAGVVRIPIERAMELQMERGFPVRKEPAK